MRHFLYTVTLLSLGTLIGLTVNNSIYLKKLDKKQVEINKTFVDMFQLQEANNNTASIIQDTLIRIFHYVKPHKEPINGCPECAEYLKGHIKTQQEHKLLNKGN